MKKAYDKACEATAAGAKAIEAVGSVMDSSGEDKYICPEHKGEVWVKKGFPYRGICNDCIVKQKGAPLKVAAGVVKGLFSNKTINT